MKRFLLILPALLLAGCGEKPAPATAVAKPATNTTARTFEVRGVIREVPPGGQALVVRHEEIPGYMPKMTMELTVRDTNEVQNLQRDDEITFRLVATEDTHWIENIRRVGRVESTNAPAPATTYVAQELKPGEELPDFELLDEHGRKLRLSEFRGQAVAFTFFFIRCPLPDFCPLMNKNFSAARRLLADQGGATNWSLLSLSFDAEFDSPAMLAGHARGYRGEDARHWLFASTTSTTVSELAPKIDFMLARDGTSFSHNLRTVVLDPQGRVQHIFNGNKWQAADLVEELKRAMQAKP